MLRVRHGIVAVMRARCAWVVLACLTGAACGGDGRGDEGQTTAVAGPRFHHAHLRVADPAAAMQRLAEAHGCEKLILQGIGVGARCGSSYVLFDRHDRPPDFPVVRAEVRVSGVGEDATIDVRAALPADDWLHAQIGGAAGALTAVAADGLPDELTHVAYADRDPAALVARLESAGARVLVRGVESTLLEAPGGFVIEVVRDIGTGPDVFWCPMHPDVRSPGETTCPLCGMALVPIPPPVFGDYQMTLDFEPVQSPTRGRLRLRFRNPHTGATATAFHTVHERVLHLFLVSRRLDWFAHVHPELQADGAFLLDVEVPRPDTYAVIADFYPAAGTPQMLQATWVTSDYRGNPFPDVAAVALNAEPKTSGSLRVSIDPVIATSGQEATIGFTVADARTGAPVTDLQPYLGAPAHLLIVSADLADVVHSHPSDIESSGPTVTFDSVFPRAGRYKLWVQFQRGGIVETASFVIELPM